MTSWHDLLAPLATLSGATLRLWSLHGDQWLLRGGPAADAPRVPREGSHGGAWLAMPSLPGHYLEVMPTPGTDMTRLQAALVAVVEGHAALLRTEEALAAELADRYEEIDLLYTIGERLGRMQDITDVAQHILAEVADVVGARRAGLRVYEPTTNLLRSVALVGTVPGVVPPVVEVTEPDVLVAQAFRSGEITTGRQPTWVPGEVVAVPIMYTTPGAPPRVVGTLALADRANGGAFTQAETKLVAAVATQIGAALENARLGVLERERAHLARELELAHDLQLHLMPQPAVLGGEAEVAVSALAAESLGGDFYTFVRLGQGRVGVMLGDVSSHGFAAALVAAQVIAMAGVHVNADTLPDQTLAALRDALGEELVSNEMYLTLFYGVLDPGTGTLSYSNAGHPHAFRVPHEGTAERLSATAPPLGLHEVGPFGRTTTAWDVGGDLLVLFTDGFVDQPGPDGEHFGETRMLTLLEAHRHDTPEAIKMVVLQDIEAWGGTTRDDRTLVVLRL